jgi:Flp pilus assembly protein TadG
MSRAIQRNKSARKGAVTAEVAICLPVLFVILFGIYEFAHVNMVIHATQSAAYEAARTAIVPGATDAETEASARSVLGSVGIRDFRVTITPPLNSNSDIVQVNVDVPFRNNTTVFRLFVANPVFRGRCEMARELF